MSEPDRRGGQRVAIGLRVRLAYVTVDEFVERFAVNVSRGGFFVRTRDPRAAGTLVKFTLLLAGGEPAVRGTGVVKWVSEPSAEGRAAPGMGIAFTSLDDASRVLVDRMVALRERQAAAPPVVVERPLATPPPTRAPTPTIPPPMPPVLAEVQRPSTPPSLREGHAGGAESKGATATPPPLPKGPSVHPERSAEGAESKGPAQADLSAPHAVQRLEAAPAVLDLGLPDAPVAVTNPSAAIIGIDLGTTNSCAAIVRNGRPYVIPSREGYNTVPSIVAVNARHKVVVGHLARAQLLSNPKDTVYGAKRLVGRPFESKPVQHIREAFAYDVVEGADGLAAVELAGHRLSLEQVAALVLREVKDVAQNHLGEEVNRAVITVPAYYNERQREAVRHAGALAGFKVERIVNEPTAAALAYAYGRRVQERVLVYDLGGGTFDASVLELQDNVYEVISTGGDTFLGGVDFDNRIVARLLERYEEQVGRPFDGDRVALSRLVDAAERAKCSLSERQEFRIQLPYLATKDGAPVALDTSLTRGEIVALVEPLVDRTLAVCADVLAAKNLAPKDVDEVILVGGQSRMPLVHDRVRAFFGKAPSHAVHPDEAVAIGAALLAYSLGSPEGVVLIDVLPMSIGVILPDGRVRPVFDRNTPLPARRQYAVTTTENGQTELELEVVQGEAPAVEDREYLGTIRLEELPSGPRGMVKLGVVFELGSEGVIGVSARDQVTNRVVRASFARRERVPRPAPRREPSPAQKATSAPRSEAARARGVAGFFRRLLGR
ncbi:MAG: TIGR02266 family protein [Anaeromyxobacteraceae bacterium]